MATPPTTVIIQNTGRKNKIFKSNIQVPEYLKQLLKQIEVDRSLSENFGPCLVEYRNYVKGKQANVLTAKQRKLLEGILGHDYCDNVCRQVVAQAQSRLKFLTWDAGDKVTFAALDPSGNNNDPTVDSDIDPGASIDPEILIREAEAQRIAEQEANKKTIHGFLKDLFIRQEMPRKDTMLMNGICTDGNSFLMLDVFQSSDNDPSKFRVRTHVQKAWDGKQGVFVRYDDEEQEEMLYVVRDWSERQHDGTFIYRRVLWQKGEMSRWISETGSSGNWEPYKLEEDPSWPIPWVDPKTGDPLPIPVVHFGNTGFSDGPIGDSELASGITAAQDHINDNQFAICASTRLAGYMIYYMTGVRPPVDADGNALDVEVEVGAGEIWSSTSADSKFGTLPPGPVDQQIAAYDHKVKSVARATSTPLHTISGGDWPSGEALLRAEQPAISKAERQLTTIQSCWTKVAYIAVLLYNVFGPGGLDDSVIIESVCDEPTRRDLLTKVTIAGLLRPFISDEEGLRLCGYEESRVQNIVKEKALGDARKAQADIAINTAKVQAGADAKNTIESTSGNGFNNGGKKKDGQGLTPGTSKPLPGKAGK